jgi:hypothetical protein
MNVIYVPLDDRACNYEFPNSLAELTDNISLLRPPKEIMGFLKTPADVEKIWEWIFENASECKYAILSVDTLVYGNLINSRIHNLSKEQCESRLENFRSLKNKYPDLKIHAFNLIARVAAYNNNFEDPKYWNEYGYDIWKYTYLLDRESRGHISELEKNEFEKLKQSIPKMYLEDFFNRREIDRFVNISSVKLLSENIFELLTIPKDDTSEYGMAAMDSEIILKKISEYDVLEKVLIHPGADEVGSVMLARVFCESKNYIPKVYLKYSSTKGAFTIPKYEDRAINESIKWQIFSVGGIITDLENDSDCLLGVNISGTNQVEAATQSEQIDQAFKVSMNIPEFLRYISYYKDRYKKAAGIAEVSCCNGCENNFMELLLKTNTLRKIQAFGGWNTAQNTIGVVLAHTVISSYYSCFENNEKKELLSESFKLGFVLADWKCQANLTPDYVKYAKAIKDYNPYRLRENYKTDREYIFDKLKIWFAEFMEKYYKEFTGKITIFEFDWDSVFFHRIKVELGKK